MLESSTYRYILQQGIEQGIEQGERKGVLASLIDVLESRFQPNEVQTLKPALENIKELQVLKQLHHQALQVPNLEAFRSVLSSNGS